MFNWFLWFLGVWCAWVVFGFGFSGWLWNVVLVPLSVAVLCGVGVI